MGNKRGRGRPQKSAQPSNTNSAASSYRDADESDESDWLPSVAPPPPKKRDNKVTVASGEELDRILSLRNSDPSINRLSNGVPANPNRRNNSVSRSRSLPGASSVAAIIAATSGAIIGRPLEQSKRNLLEMNSPFTYAYPRHSGYTTDRAGGAPRAEWLDLMLDGDVSDGETEGDKDYKINGLLFIDTHSMLVDWEGFHFPTWEPRNVVKAGTALTEYKLRYKIREIVREYLFGNESSTMTRGSTDNYPHLSLIQTMNYGEYVKHPGIVYLAGLGRRERQINEFLEEKYGTPVNGGPTIIFVDCTNFKTSSIPTFEYIIDSVLSPEVVKLEKQLQYDRTSCTCTTNCFHRGCCASKAESNVAYVNTHKLGNIVKLKNISKRDEGGFEEAKDCVDVYECGDNCGCDANKEMCQQRVLQKGVPIKLAIFRHYEKGWTVRAGCFLRSGTYVIAYVGEMILQSEAEKRTNKKYQIDLDVKLVSGQTAKLVIDAHKKGNVARYISHSCNPNLFSYRVHCDVKGRPKRHIGLFAARDIQPGEEMYYNYFAGVTDPVEFKKKTDAANFTCKCSTPGCLEVAYQELMRQKQKKNNK